MQRIAFFILSIALAFTNTFPLGAFSYSHEISAPLQQEETATLSPTAEESTQTPTLESTFTPEVLSTSTKDITATSTLEPSEVVTTPTIELTETVSPTMEQTEVGTSTPEATLTTEEIQEEVFLNYLDAKASPRFLRPGGKINLHWYLGVDPSQVDGTFSLRIQAPSYVVVEEGEPFSINSDGIFESTNALDKSNGKVELEVLDENIEGNSATIIIQLFRNGEQLAEKKLDLVIAKHVSKEEGGEVSGAKDNRAKVFFPPDALPEDADVVVMNLDEEDGSLTTEYSDKPWHPFKIEAYTKNGEEIKNFDQEITIEYAYDPEEYAGNESVLYLSYFDEEIQGWVPLPSNVDLVNKQIIAQSDHLTVLNPNFSDWQAAMLPDLTGWQVSKFTGAATYSVPLTLPAGPGGFQPSLELSYNSQVIDNASLSSQASWVGMGWSLDTPYIQRDNYGTMDNVADDLFYIHMNGISGLLIKGNDGYWHTEDVNFARIELHGDTTSYESWWEVWLQDGTQYKFGLREGNEKSIADYPYCKSSSEPVKLPWRWSVSHIVNSFGKVIRYKYTLHEDWRDPIGCSSNPTAAFWIYPKEIDYPNNAYRIVFNRGERKDFDYMWRPEIAKNARTAFMAWRLDSIDIEHNPDSDAGFIGTEKIRRYQFTYANDGLPNIENTIIWPNHEWSNGLPAGDQNKTLTLIQFQEQVWGENGQWNNLPPYTFNYGTGVTTDGFTYPNGDAQHLYWAQNGYGGRIEFTYSPWSCNNDDCSYAWNSSDQNDAWKKIYGNFGESQGDLGPTVVNYSYWYNWHQKTMTHPGAAYELHMMVERTNAGGTVPFTVNVDNGKGSVRNYLNTTITAYAGWYEFNLKYFLDGNSAPGAAVVKTSCGTGEVGCHLFQFQYRYLPTFYRVTTMKTIDQQSGRTYTNTYSYSGGMMNKTLIGQYKTWMLHPPYTEFYGFNQMIETAPDGHKTIYSFWQGEERDSLGNWIGKHLQGRLKEVKVTTVNEAEVLQRKVYNYECTYGDQAPYVKATGFWLPSGVELYWVRLIAEEEYSYAGNESSYIAKKTVYDYDLSAQGGLQLGNLTHTIEFEWKNGAWQAARGVKTTFYPNISTTKYLAGLPGLSQTFACSGSGCNFSSNPTSQIQYIYDANTNYSTAPAVGKLTRKRSQTDSSRYRDELYGYDAWGNLIASTKYTGYGTASTFATQGAQTTTYCYGSAEVANCPDDGHHTYLLWTQDAIPSHPQATYSYNLRTGNLLTEKDLNGYITRAEYDVLGRLIRIYLPGDAANSPSLNVNYHFPVNSSDYFWTNATQKVNGSTSRSMYKLYNGLGQLVQTQIPNTTLIDNSCADSGNPDNCAIVTDYYEGYAVDAGILYKISKSSLPHAVYGLVGGTYSSPSGSLKWGTTYYDALGREVKQVTTSDLVTWVNYAIESLSVSGATANYLRTQTIEDAEDPSKNVVTEQYSDAFGRLIAVIPAEGSRIVYTYDTLDHLTKTDQVRSDTLATFSTTTINYDMAGRKTGMVDPAMGTWNYAYDATGNLVYQQNQANKNTCLYYDAINRLVGKVYYSTIPSPSCPSATQYSIRYYYDEGTNGKGKRTRMVDTSGTTTWAYNNRGQVISEQHAINELPAGEDPYTLGYGYDNTGAITTLTYPDGEVVNSTYYSNGWPKGLASSLGETFVTNTQYDALGRQNLVNYGNGLKLNYSYHSWVDELTENRGNLEQVNLTNGQNVSLFSQSFSEYDQAGNILNMSMTTPASSTQNLAFSYDALYRLRTATANDGNISGYTLNYAFDITGRINSVTQGSETNAYTYGSGTNRTAVTGMGNNTYSYDPLGNMTSRKENGITYLQEWTPENKLKKVSWTEDDQKFATSYVYDGDGNRVLQIEETRSLTDQIISEITTVYIGKVFEKQINTTGMGLGAIFASVPILNSNLIQAEENNLRPQNTYSISYQSRSENETDAAILPQIFSSDQKLPEKYVELPGENLRILQGGSGGVIGPNTYPATLHIWCEMDGSEEASDANMTLIMVIILSNGQMTQCDAGRYGNDPAYHKHVSVVLPANVTGTISYYRVWFGGNVWDWTPYSGTNLTVTREAGVRLYSTPNGKLRQSVWTEIESNNFYNGLFPNLRRSRWWFADQVNPAGYGVTFFAIVLGENDVTAPTNPSSANPGCTAGNNVWQKTCSDPNFTWSGASDAGSGLDGYYYYWGTSSAGTSTNFTTASNFNPTAVTSGTYFLRIQAKDKAGNLAAWKTLYTFKYDNTIPTVPSNAVDAQGVTSNVAQSVKYDPNFTWSAATDAHSGLSGYNVYWGSSPSGSTITKFVTTASFDPAPLTSSGTFYLRIQSKDKVGNLSAWANMFTYIYNGVPAKLGLVDILLGEGTSKAFAAGGKVYFAPTAIGNFQIRMKTGNEGVGFSVGVNSLTFPNIFSTSDGATLDLGGTLLPGTYSHTYVINYNASGTFNGTYTATLKDVQQNTSQASFTVEMDSTAPNPGNLSFVPTGNGINFEKLNRTIYYSASCADALSISLSPADSQSGVKEVVFPALFGSPETTDTAAPFQQTFSVSGASNTQGTFTLNVKDRVLNGASSAAFTIVKDGTAPVVSIHAAAENTLRFRVAWQSEDDLSGIRGFDVEYRQEPAGSWNSLLPAGTTKTQVDFTGEVGVSYKFRVRAIDNVGNTSAWVESGTATVRTTVTKYYYLAGQRVAMRQGGSVYYLYGDHLGSTSLITNAGGVNVSERRYLPYGQVYWQSGASQTDFGFTGQRMDGFALLDYNARYYDPLIGRFIQADTIVSQPGNPLAWDRYVYVNFNPISIIDPSGHMPCDEGNEDVCHFGSHKEKTRITDAKAMIWKAGYQPDSSCFSDSLCSDSYSTFVQVVTNLGRVPSETETLMMTASAEYYAISGYNGGFVGLIGQEALARNYYSACKTNGCQGRELYSFMAGYQPWYGSPYKTGDGSSSLRSRVLISGLTGYDFTLRDDMSQVIDVGNATIEGWVTGKRPNEPWQWFTFRIGANMNPKIGAYTPDYDAILGVDLGNDQVFWMFTGAQDDKFDPDDWR